MKVEFFEEADILTQHMLGIEPIPFEEIVRSRAPWAAEIVKVDGGWRAFEDMKDAEAWKAQA